MIDFLPTPAIALSLLTIAMLPVFLLVLSHGFWRVGPPGRRFLLAAAMTVIAWGLLLGRLSEVDGIDLVAGSLVVGTVLLAGFTVWTLIAWGFTLSMLMALRREGGTLTLTDWIRAYTAGKTIETFTHDRLGVLFRLGFAASRGTDIFLTPGRGRPTARVTLFLRALFGLSK